MNQSEKRIAEALDQIEFSVGQEFQAPSEYFMLMRPLAELRDSFMRLTSIRYFDLIHHPVRQPPTPSSAAAVYARDGYQCRYCGGVEGPWHLDHVFPVIQGGTSEPGNLVVACETCNCRKGGRTPEQAGMVLLDVPNSPLPKATPKEKPEKPEWLSDEFDVDLPEDLINQNR